MTSSPLRFDGKVVLVTGAGGGIGREYALAFADRGASVVVNDLGGDFKGAGKSSRAADVVVEEIKAKGGRAVANYNSVEDGDKLVQTALDNFGRIDIVINNAGIIRDRSFARTSDLDWDLVHRVHLRGAFKVTQAAWPHMKQNNFGRIIMTTSSSGIYGNFGQSNYSSAKLGLLGLSNTLAREGLKNNILCNTIAPTAGSRMTNTVMPKDITEQLQPEYIAPLVMYLCHEACDENGNLFEVGGGWISKLRWERTKGAVLRRRNVRMTPEDVRDNWDKVTDFTDADRPTSTQDTIATLMQALGRINDDDTDLTPETSSGTDSDYSGGFDVNLAKNHRIKDQVFTYEARDVILYALGLGVSTRHEGHLKFLFEGNEDFCVLPSFAVISAQMSMSGVFSGEVPGLQVNLAKLLHGEQYLELYKPLPTNGTLTSKVSIPDVLDKGSGAVILLNVETFDDSGEKVSFNQFSLFILGAGGFGGKRSSDKAMALAKPPSRSPDASVQETTSVDQAALYRLSGDRNPLHIDPSFAAMGGFNTPILHGLCSFGYACRHVLQTYANNDVSLFKAIKVRMSKPVLPGQTLQTNMWREGNRIHFECKVVENGNIALSGAYVDLHEVNTSNTPNTQDVSALKSDAVFVELSKRIEARPDLVKKINTVYLWNITVDKKPAAQWTLDLKNGPGSVYRGEPKTLTADCTLTISDEDLVSMMSGKLNARQAFLSAKLKVKGNVMLSQKLAELFQDQAKL